MHIHIFEPRRNNTSLILSLFVLIIILFGSCSKVLDVNSPSDTVNQGNVYASNANAIAVLNGIYATMSRTSLPDGASLNSFMSLYPGLSADELTLYSGSTNNNYLDYYHNDLTSHTLPSIWLDAYKYIFIVNEAIEGISSSEQLSPEVKQELLGAAKFLRAFHYFYLTNLYGDVPLVTTTDYKINSIITRSPANDIYAQIISDLQQAEVQLSDNFVGKDVITVTSERVLPNKWAAKALLARTYLYTKDYTNAIKYASEVIDNNSLFELVDLNNVFLANSREAIWQLQPVNQGWNTEDGRLFVLPDTGPSETYPVYVSPYLLGGFEAGDERRASWLDSIKVDGMTYYYPYKYKNGKLDEPVTEYQMMLRLAEMYLIRGEAYANNNDLSSAINDLNIIRNRAGLDKYAGAEVKESIISAILQERRIELFSEWGHRWLDLKRTARVDNVMSSITSEKGGTWSTTDQLYPINTSELSINQHLIQNTGY